MQRQIAAFVLAAVSLLAGLRLTVAARDSEAMRCAIACGHAAAAQKGAACCPMSAAGPSFKACASGDAALVRVTAAQPAVLAAAAPLATPASTRASDLDVESRLRFAPPRPLDHVPLLFG